MHIQQLAMMTNLVPANLLTEAEPGAKTSEGVPGDFLAMLMLQVQGILAQPGTLQAADVDAAEVLQQIEGEEGSLLPDDLLAQIKESLENGDEALPAELLTEVWSHLAAAMTDQQGNIHVPALQSTAAKLVQAMDLDEAAPEWQQRLAAMLKPEASVDGTAWTPENRAAFAAQFVEAVSDATGAEGKITVAKAVALLQSALREGAGKPSQAEATEAESATAVQSAASTSQTGGAAAAVAQTDSTPVSEASASGSSADRAVTLPATAVRVEQFSEVAASSVRYIAANGEKTMTVRLIPESLGEVRIEVTHSGDKVAVKLAAANPAARVLLENQVQQLQQSLATEGLDVAKVTVSAHMGSSRQDNNGFMQQHAASGNASSGVSAGSPQRMNAVQVASADNMAHSLHEGSLNLFV